MVCGFLVMSVDLFRVCGFLRFVCGFYLGSVDFYVLSVDFYVMSVDFYLWSVNFYILSVYFISSLWIFTFCLWILFMVCEFLRFVCGFYLRSVDFFKKVEFSYPMEKELFFLDYLMLCMSSSLHGAICYENCVHCNSHA